MFQFDGLPPPGLFHSARGARAWPLAGSPIRAPRDRRPFAPPPGLSRLAAPFVGFLRQGIRRAPTLPSLSAFMVSQKVGSGYRSISDGCISLCIAIADANPGAPSRRRGFSRIRILVENRVRIEFSHDVSISMKRYAAVKVRGARAPGAGCWKGRAGRARSPRVE